jgi:CHAT domain-containing protein
LSAQLSHISIQLKALKTAIEKKYPQNKTLYSLKAIQQKLAKNQAVLVAYFYGRNAIYQFVISETNISVETIPLTTDTKESIINFIHLFDNASIINNAINQYTTRAFGVYNLLKFNQTASYRNVVIIPDGLLNFVPFEALLSSKTASTVFANMPFVVKNQTVAYNSSVQFFLTESTIVNNNKLLGFFPVFEHSNQKLTYSIDEAQAIKKEMPSTIFLNAQSSKGNFIKHAPNFGILHVSTHASSGNFVTPANISFFDDTMYLNELYSLDLNAHLVVLSACETGVGKLYKGEGAMSIARGFQYAGAENLLFTLWQINDLSTSQIMESFY